MMDTFSVLRTMATPHYRRRHFSFLVAVDIEFHQHLSVYKIACHRMVFPSGLRCAGSLAFALCHYSKASKQTNKHWIILIRLWGIKRLLWWWTKQDIIIHIRQKGMRNARMFIASAAPSQTAKQLNEMADKATRSQRQQCLSVRFSIVCAALRHLIYIFTVCAGKQTYASSLSEQRRHSANVRNDSSDSGGHTRNIRNIPSGAIRATRTIKPIWYAFDIRHSLSDGVRWDAVKMPLHFAI